MFRFAFVAAVAFACASTYASAPVIRANKMVVAPTIDGTINDAEWQDAATFEGLFDAQTGQPSPEGGHFWIGYDGKYIYFAAKLTDSQPNAIRATEYRTNVDLPGDDTVGISLDLSGSLSDFSSFQTNPRGATSVTLTGGRAAKREWTGEFQAMSRLTPTGWESEMRIPWNILPIPAGGRRNVRFNVMRTIPRLNRQFQHVYSDGGHLADTPVWQQVDLPKPAVDRSLLLLPYAYAGYGRDNGSIFNAGMDLKTNLTDQIHLVGTVNPDFRNIENAILSLDFSRFARIADESRPFFQEGAEYLNSALFTSQTISKFDVGVNSYGKINDQVQFGVLDTVDFGHENATVANVSYAPNAQDNYRVTVTERSSPGYENNAHLIRYNRQLGAWSLFLRDMGSRDTSVGAGQNDDFEVGYNKGGLLGFVDYTRVTENFHPGLGFFPETNYKGISSFFQYVHPFDHGSLQNYNASFSTTDFTRINGDRYRSEIYGSAGVITRPGTALNLTIDRPVFEGSHDRIDTVSATHPAGDPYRNATLAYSWGEISSQPYRLVTVGSAYRPISKLQLTLSYQKYHLGQVDTDQTVLGGNFDLGSDRSLSGRLVQTHGSTNAYAAYRRSGNRGAEYYLIVGDPNALKFRTSLILKVVVPFKI